MQSTPILRVTLAPSRFAAAAIGAAVVATAVLIATMPGEPWWRGMAIVAAGGCGIHALRHAASLKLRRSIVAIELGADRRGAMVERCGRRIEGVVRTESYVGALLTTLVLRPDGARRSRAVAIAPDMMSVADFRRLRVLLRHGEAAGGDAKA
ncbi:MAG: protein YgfX [Casimicrobiaceae bacterium]